MTTRTVVPTGASSKTLAEYGVVSKTGEYVLASDTLMYTVAVSLRPPESVALTVKTKRFSYSWGN